MWVRVALGSGRSDAEEGPEERAQSVQCLPCKYEDLSLTPEPREIVRSGALVIPAREVETGTARSSLASQCSLLGECQIKKDGRCLSNGTQGCPLEYAGLFANICL